MQELSSRIEAILHFCRITTSCCRVGGINRKNCEKKGQEKLVAGRKGKKMPAQEV
jgi:hypothetical protein